MEGEWRGKESKCEREGPRVRGRKRTEGSRVIRAFSQTFHFLYQNYQNFVLHPIPCVTHGHISLVPSPIPSFRRLQYDKAGRARYISSREHDIIDKWQN